MENRDESWLRAEIAKGLARLLVLRLPGFPAEDAIRPMAEVWLAAIQDAPVGWCEERDRQRVAQAFVTLTRVCDHWPAPRTLLEYLPPRPEALRLPDPPITDQEIRRNIRKGQKLIQWLTAKMGAKSDE